MPQEKNSHKFTVELITGAHKIPLSRHYKAASWKGNVLRVASGKWEFLPATNKIAVQTSIPGEQEKKFEWEARCVIFIRNEFGLPLWVNPKKDEMQRREFELSQREKETVRIGILRDK